ncbi:MAG: glycosyltransferase family 9 protein, partial [Vicinamibacteria bacterium]
SVLSQAGVYVGNDSGVSHLAAASGAPTIALFGPTDPSMWAPLGPQVEILPQTASDQAVWEAARVFTRP